MSQSSETVLSTFQTSCDEYAKLFIPEPRQEAIVASLVSYYEKYHTLDILLLCVKEFVRVSDDPILVYDFALKSSKIRERIIENLASKKAFDDLVKETERRMREFDEL